MVLSLQRDGLLSCSESFSSLCGKYSACSVKTGDGVTCFHLKLV